MIRWALLVFIRVYQRLVSPLLGADDRSDRGAKEIGVLVAV
jgi:hypothetical protein